MFAIPTEGTPARELLGDLSHVAELLHPNNRNKLPTFGRALLNARAFMATADKSVKRVSYICYGNCNMRNQHGQIVLVSVGRRGGWRLEWAFGSGR